MYLGKKHFESLHDQPVGSDWAANDSSELVFMTIPQFFFKL